jgi:hypothetical protein
MRMVTQLGTVARVFFIRIRGRSGRVLRGGDLIGGLQHGVACASKLAKCACVTGLTNAVVDEASFARAPNDAMRTCKV